MKMKLSVHSSEQHTSTSCGDGESIPLPCSSECVLEVKCQVLPRVRDNNDNCFYCCYNHSDSTVLELLNTVGVAVV